MHDRLFSCRGAYAGAVSVYGENAQQPIVATVMEEMDNFTCPPPSGKLIGGCGVVLNNGFTLQPFIVCSKFYNIDFSITPRRPFL